jgi:hypothetical protein
MVVTTKEASYIIVLGVVISLHQISSTLLQDGYHVHFKQNSKQNRRVANQTFWISSKHMGPINLHSDGIADAISNCHSDTILVTISDAIHDCTKAISGRFPSPFPSPIPIIPIAAYCFKRQASAVAL